jgi:hypothetical protein
VSDGPASDAAVEQLVDFWTPLAVRALAAAGVFAELGDGARDPDDVARVTGVHAATLRRFLRAVASRGVVEDAGDGRVRLTPLGLRLVPGRPGSLAGLATLKSFELHAWAEVEQALTTGEATFPLVHDGLGLFAWLATDPARSAQFDATMRARTSALLEAGLPLADWPAHGTVVDVGGGTGHLLEQVLADRPGLRGVVFDLAHVVEGARAPLAAAGLADRVEVVAGSFFEAVPAGGDLYVLSNILHDWADSDALRILRCVRAAIPPRGRLRLFEAVLRAEAGGLGAQLDLHMLVLLGAEERTRDGWEALLAAGGFRLAAVIPTPGFAWIDADPV